MASVISHTDERHPNVVAAKREAAEKAKAPKTEVKSEAKPETKAEAPKTETKK